MILRRARIILIVFSVWVLSISLSSVRFAPGKWKVLTQSLRQNPPSLETLAAIFLVLALLVFCGVVFMLATGRGKKKKDDDDYKPYVEPRPIPWSVYVILLGLFAALGWLVWYASQTTTVTQQEGSAILERALPKKQTPKLPSQASEQPSFTLKSPYLDFGEYLIALAIFAGLSWILWRSWKTGRPEPEVEEPDIGRLAATAAVDLAEGGDLSDIVLRCYRDMCTILARKVAMRREMTAREFAGRLQDAGVREQEISELTELFEKVRYGRFLAGPEERAEAIALLKAVERQYGKSADEA